MRATAQQPQRAPDGAPVHYERHRPEQTTLYRLVQQHAASFIAHTEASTGAELPRFIKDEFEAFLECGILAHGFLRLRCGECDHDKLLAFSCKRRGFCPSCGARRMSQTAAHLVDHVIRHGDGAGARSRHFRPSQAHLGRCPGPLNVLCPGRPGLLRRLARRGRVGGPDGAARQKGGEQDGSIHSTPVRGCMSRRWLRCLPREHTRMARRPAARPDARAQGGWRHVAGGIRTPRSTRCRCARCAAPRRRPASRPCRRARSTDH